MKNYVAVITTFNRKEKLKKAIKCLKEQEFKPQKIIIVDNASTDGTDILMKDYLNDSMIKYLKLNENIGGSGGFYYGIKKALQYDPDYIAVSDDDAWYLPDYFEKIKRKSAEYPEVGAFIGVAEDPQTHEKTNQGAVLTDWKTLSKTSPITDNNYCNLITFCGFVFKAALIQKIGLPQKNFFIWLDDNEYGLRISKLTKILLVKDAILLHLKDKRGNNNLIPYWKNYYGFRNGIKLREEFTTNKISANLYNLRELLQHTLAILLKTEYKNQKINYLKSYWYGFVDGYLNKMGKNNKFLPDKENKEKK